MYLNAKRKSYLSNGMKDNLFIRLSKVEMQVSAIKNLIEQDVYFNDVTSQLAKVKSALYHIEKMLYNEHVKMLIFKSIQEENKDILEDVIYTTQRLMKK